MNAIERVTPYPSRYTEEPEEWELEELLAREEEQWERASAGKFWMRAELCREEKVRKSLSATERRDAVRVMSDVLGKRAEYQRKEGDYKIGEWIVTNCSITSDFEERRADLLSAEGGEDGRNTHADGDGRARAETA